MKYFTFNSIATWYCEISFKVSTKSDVPSEDKNCLTIFLPWFSFSFYLKFNFKMESEKIRKFN